MSESLTALSVNKRSRVLKKSKSAHCSLNSDLTAVHNWFKTSKFSWNTSKTSYMRIGSRQNLATAKFMNLKMDDSPIEHKPSTKLLEVYIDEMLTWDKQIKHISS